MITPPPTIWMTPDELYLWRISHRFSKRMAATALGIARNTFFAYEKGHQPIPRYIALAAAKISADNPPVHYAQPVDAQAAA